MKLKRFILFTWTFLFLLGSSIMAQDLISVSDLNKAIMKKSVVVVDARSAAKFKADAHIKNAVNVAYSDLHQTAPVKGVLKSTDEMAKILGAAGVDGKKPVVVYDEGSGKFSGRVYWILKYLGVSDVKILNGNLKAWKAARKPITKNPTMVKKTTFTAKINSPVFATAEDVKKGGVVLIDARSAAEFSGTDGKSKGHIPGAKNIVFEEMLNADGTMKSAADLAGVFAGIDKSKAIIVYCETSVRAGIVYFALTSVLAYPNVKVYDGAYNEWISLNNSVEK